MLIKLAPKNFTLIDTRLNFTSGKIIFNSNR